MQTEMQTALTLIRLFLFRPALFAQKKNSQVTVSCGSYDYFNDKLSPKPTLIKPIKPTELGFMIKPGFYANPDYLSQFQSRTTWTYPSWLSINNLLCPGTFFCLHMLFKLSNLVLHLQS